MERLCRSQRLQVNPQRLRVVVGSEGFDVNVVVELERVLGQELLGSSLELWLNILADGDNTFEFQSPG